jgi:hypothetical protein
MILYIILIILGVHAVIGGLIWMILERYEDMQEWNLRQRIYMMSLHGPFVLLWMIHRLTFTKLGQPTKYERAYKNITQ